MPAETHRDPTGRIKQTPFRFDANTLADLDAITFALSLELGSTQSRADALRILIRRERDRRAAERAAERAKKKSEKNPG